MKLNKFKEFKIVTFPKNNHLPKSNHEIKAPNVRLVDQNNEMIGIVDLATAMKKAAAANLDLVEIAPQSEPPVCKILDFGKFKYEAKKKVSSSKKKQKTVVLKEIKLRPNIGNHDLQVKLKQIRGFIEDGDKVKISLRFRGREITHNELGMAIMTKILEDLGESVKTELEPKMEGSQIMMVLVAK